MRLTGFSSVQILSIRRSIFGVRCSAFGVAYHDSRFTIHGLRFGVPAAAGKFCSVFGIGYSVARNSRAWVLLIPFSMMSSPLKILVVEDEKALAHLTAMMLGGPASEVTMAKNGWEALMKIGAAARPFDVVITDHRMPRATGLELVRRLREKNFAGKILVLSGHLGDEDISAYEELNVDMMMTKPFDFDELQDAMAVLNRKASALAGV